MGEGRWGPVRRRPAVTLTLAGASHLLHRPRSAATVLQSPSVLQSSSYWISTFVGSVWCTCTRGSSGPDLGCRGWFSKGLGPGGPLLGQVELTFTGNDRLASSSIFRRLRRYQVPQYGLPFVIQLTSKSWVLIGFAVGRPIYLKIMGFTRVCHWSPN